MNTIKFHPILFSTPMVQAILTGQKFQTRRTKGLEKITNHYFQSMVHHYYGRFTFVENENLDPTNEDVVEVECPNGKVGDVLWVRETFAYSDDLDKPYWYKQNFEEEYEKEYLDRMKGIWKPSIHMPKEACRLFLKITDIRVEQLQNISRGDAMAEGCPFPNIARQTDPQLWFQELWISINGKESWYKNPWVWVISFERIEKPENFI